LFIAICLFVIGMLTACFSQRKIKLLLVAAHSNGTSNRLPRTGNWQPTTDNQQLATDNPQLTTSNRQPTTDNPQPTTSN
jgi:hypothetical protein